MELPLLYQKAKSGKIIQWKIWTEGDKIYKQYGEIGGKLQTTPATVCKGKNIGKSNETTPVQQAELEAKAEWQHKLEKKYSESPDAAENDRRNLPMLAYEIDKIKKIVFPVLGQPKFNGLRTLARWDGENVVLVSRGNKRYNLPHLTDYIETILPKGEELDGEIYKHGFTLEEINRRVKKYRPGKTEELEYHNYDKPSDLICKDRIDDLDDFYKKYKIKDKLVKSETVWLNSLEEVLAYEKKKVIEGYEGAIVRIPNAPYTYGKKVRHLLKVKSFKDDEFKIVGFEEGVGKNEGCVTWICETKDHKTFKVIPKGTYNKKKYWYEHGTDYIGKLLTVKYFDLSENGIPFLPVGKPSDTVFRLPEDLDIAA